MPLSRVPMKEIVDYFSTSIYLSRYAIGSNSPLKLLVANILNPMAIIFLPKRLNIQTICSKLVRDTTLILPNGKGEKRKIVIPDYRSMIIVILRYEYDEYRAIIKATQFLKIREFDIVISAGAHIGKWIFQLEGLYDLFVAIEPNPITFYYLVKNTRINRLRNVIVIKCGLSNKNGILPFEVNPYKLDTSRVSQKGNVQIPVYILDYLIRTLKLDCENKPMLIILDVEDHEEFVLEGAVETLKNNKVALYIELEVEKQNLSKEKKF